MYTLPTHCAGCGVVLMGGATQHELGCPIRKMIEDAFKEVVEVESGGGKLFRVEGWGVVGEANLWAFVPLKDQKPWQTLEVNESTVGHATGCGVGAGKTVRTDKVTRIK